MVKTSLASAAYAYLEARQSFEEADEFGTADEVAAAREKLLAAQQNFSAQRECRTAKTMPSPRSDEA